MITLIGYDSDSVYTEPLKVKVKRSYFRKGMICCYCHTELNKVTCTREHIIPKSKGGKIIAPCCIDCNREKGGGTIRMFITYIILKNRKDPRIEIASNLAKKHKL